MPSIVVVRDSAADEAGEFQFKERVTAPLLDDPHFAAQMIERLAWAVGNAEHAERGARSAAAAPLGRAFPGRRLPRATRSHPWVCQRRGGQRRAGDGWPPRS